MKLPDSAKVDKVIPKNQFYNRFVINNKLKNEFIDKIQKIIWSYKLSESTIGISKTKKIEEIQIFTVELKEKLIPKNVLKLIDKAIPYPILFIFKHRDDVAYGISLKDDGILENYYLSQWNEKIEFDFISTNLERVYQKIIKKFIKSIEITDKEFDEIVETDDKIKKTEIEIEKLKNKLRQEKQFNKKVIKNQELNKQKILLKKLQNN
ncbi:MAG: DUF4391 domain-containing protein [Patescibacteria group bacterium]|nr:DUF4391 domain-containing protein [Patescibacteria group bacterium]